MLRADLEGLSGPVPLRFRWCNRHPRIAHPGQRHIANVNQLRAQKIPERVGTNRCGPMRRNKKRDTAGDRRGESLVGDPRRGAGGGCYPVNDCGAQARSDKLKRGQVCPKHKASVQSRVITRKRVLGGSGQRVFLEQHRHRIIFQIGRGQNILAGKRILFRKCNHTFKVERFDLDRAAFLGRFGQADVIFLRRDQIFEVRIIRSALTSGLSFRKAASILGRKKPEDAG